MEHKERTTLEMIDGLTPREVLQYFPKEAKEMVHREYVFNIADRAPYDLGMVELVESDYDDNTKMFLLKVWAMSIPKQILNNIKRLGLLKRLMLNKRSVILAQDVKHVAIETLHTFEKVRRYSKRIVALCPLPDHKEKSPSFYIFTEENKFHCFGCGAHGDVIDFIMKLHGIDFKQAINFIAR